MLWVAEVAYLVYFGVRRVDRTRQRQVLLASLLRVRLETAIASPSGPCLLLRSPPKFDSPEIGQVKLRHPHQRPTRAPPQLSLLLELIARTSSAIAPEFRSLNRCQLVLNYDQGSGEVDETLLWGGELGEVEVRSRRRVGNGFGVLNRDEEVLQGGGDMPSATFSPLAPCRVSVPLCRRRTTREEKKSSPRALRPALPAPIRSCRGSRTHPS